MRWKFSTRKMDPFCEKKISVQQYLWTCWWKSQGGHWLDVDPKGIVQTQRWRDHHDMDSLSLYSCLRKISSGALLVCFPSNRKYDIHIHKDNHYLFFILIFLDIWRHQKELGSYFVILIWYMCISTLDTWLLIGGWACSCEAKEMLSDHYHGLMGSPNDTTW